MHRGPVDRLCLLSSAVRDEPAGTIAGLAASAGFTRIEWGAGPGQATDAAPGEAAELRALCEQHALAIAGVCVQAGTATLDEPESIRQVVGFAAGLGAPFIRFWAPGFRGGSIERELERVRGVVAASVAIARELGVVLLLENAPATIAPSTTLVRALLEGIDPTHAGVLWDPANALIEGSLDPAIAISELGPYLHHVHAKNIAWSRTDGAWSWGYTTIAEGMVDWPAVLGALAAAGYDGPISLDHLSSEPTAAGLRHDADELRSLAADASAQR